MGEAMSLPTQFGPDGLDATLGVLQDTGCAVFASVPLARGRAVRRLPAFVRAAFPALHGDAQCALQFARSSPAITSVLVGMRRLEHVDENLALAAQPPASEALIKELFQKSREAARPS